MVDTATTERHANNQLNFRSYILYKDYTLNILFYSTFRFSNNIEGRISNFLVILILNMYEKLDTVKSC